MAYLNLFFEVNDSLGMFTNKKMNKKKNPLFCLAREEKVDMHTNGFSQNGCLIDLNLPRLE